MYVINPAALSLENVAPGTAIAIIGRIGSGRTTLARTIVASIQLQRTGTIHVVAMHSGSGLTADGDQHIEYTDLVHTASAGGSGDTTADILVFEDAAAGNVPRLPANNSSVAIVTSHHPVGVEADITVLLGKTTRNRFREAFGYEYHLPEGVPFLGRDVAYVARKGDRPVLFTWKPLSRPA